MTAIDVGLLALRVWAGVVMIAHGANHARKVEGTTSWFGKVGFKAPRINAMLSAVGELAIGAALVVGLFTPVAAAGLAAIMTVAFWSIHRFAGFFVFHRPDEGYEYVATLGVIALALAIAGPGSVSIDALLGLDQSLNGWVGAAIFAAGLAVAAVQLALFWNRPD
ncbi:MAG: DoxX family protein [Acidimicrobiia bacterium]